MSKEIMKMKDYLEHGKTNTIIKKTAQAVLSIDFDKIFESPNLNQDLNNFVIKPKQAYYNNFSNYLPYINYFMEYFDEDRELLTAYLNIKFNIDRGDTTSYPLGSFMQDIEDYILKESMIEKVKNMVNYNYSLTLSKNKDKNVVNYEAIGFSDEQGIILLNISTVIKLLIPLVTHYIHIYKNVYNETGEKLKSDQVLATVFLQVGTALQEDNNLFNKLYEFILSKINKFRYTDSVHWNQVGIFGETIESKTEEILNTVFVDIIYKFSFEGNIIAMASSSIRNMVNWNLKGKFSRNLREINDIAPGGDDESLSDFDKIEILMSKFDESVPQIASLNVKQTIKYLQDKYEIEWDADEIKYYEDNVNLIKEQEEILFSLFYKYLGNSRDIVELSKKQMAKLIIIMKTILSARGMKLIQYVITGNMYIDPHKKKSVPKKIANHITNSDSYHQLERKYKSMANVILSEKNIFTKINILINAQVKLVDYELREYEGQVLNKNISFKDYSSVIIDEYLKVIDMI